MNQGAGRILTELGIPAAPASIFSMVALEKPLQNVHEEIDALVAEYEAAYDVATDDTAAIRYQARKEIVIKRMDAVGCKAFSKTFQDL